MATTNEGRIEQLEASLDGALTPDEAEALRLRIDREPALSAKLDQLRAERAVRISAFATMEGTEALPDRLLGRAAAHLANPARRRSFSPLRYAVAAAACLLAGFVAGTFMDDRNTTAPTQLTSTSDSKYRVAITDDAGRVIAVQPFDSLEQATEFSEDLRRWQERQEQIRNGHVTIRSANF